MTNNLTISISAELVEKIDKLVGTGGRSKWIAAQCRKALKGDQKENPPLAADADDYETKVAPETIVETRECPQHYWFKNPVKPARGTNENCDTHTCVQCINEAQET